MRVVIQRVSTARVEVAGQTVGEIGQGLLVLLGVEKGDTEAAADWLVEKITTLRIFNDDAGKMNLSLQDISGAMLVVSQFTLAGNCNKGRRPSFDSAAPLDEGKRLYEYFVSRASQQNLMVQTGIFQADMQVTLTNDGPVTFVMDKRS